MNIEFIQQTGIASVHVSVFGRTRIKKVAVSCYNCITKCVYSTQHWRSFHVSLNKNRSPVQPSESCTRRYMYTGKMPPIKYSSIEMYGNDWGVLNGMT